MNEYYNNMSYLDKETLIKILNHVASSILVVDKTGKVLFYPEISLEGLNIDHETLISSNIYEWEDMGLVDRYAVCAQVLDKKETVVSKVVNVTTDRVVTGTPVFDKSGEIEMVVATSMDEVFLNDIIRKVLDDKENLSRTISYFNKDSLAKYEIFSKNKRMIEIYSFAEKAAKSQAILTIYGESGTGKEVMARFIHDNSSRSSDVFLPVNCAAIPAELMESEFFGYAKGAFTGANSNGKPGFFELAQTGTIFLDEIGELPLSMQSKLLRVLESGEFMRVGGEKSVKNHARIIAATNRDLSSMVADGTFREDLYYRINVIPIYLLPLRERKEDIEYLSNLFLKEHNKQQHKSLHFSDTTKTAFLSYSWPGNIRELRNVVERLTVTSEANEIDITLSYLQGPQYVTPSAVLSSNPTIRSLNSDDPKPLKDAVAEFEKSYISAVIEKNQGNISKSAQQLGFHRSSLYKKIASLNSKK